MRKRNRARLESGSRSTVPRGIYRQRVLLLDISILFLKSKYIHWLWANLNPKLSPVMYYLMFYFETNPHWKSPFLRFITCMRTIVCTPWSFVQRGRGSNSRNDPVVWLVYSESTRWAANAHICETSQQVAKSVCDI